MYGFAVIRQLDLALVNANRLGRIYDGYQVERTLWEASGLYWLASYAGLCGAELSV